MLLRLVITVVDPKNEYSFYVMSSVPLLVMGFLILMCRKMMRNYRMVVQIVDSPVEVKFTEFEKNRDPLANLGRLKKPAFLNISLDPNNHLNRHESLFWFGRPDLSF